MLYGAGLRLMESLRLRVKDLDFDRKILIVREGKGRKDRVVMLPEPLIHALRFGLKIAPAECPVYPCQMHSLESIRALAKVGPGMGVPVPDPISRSPF